MFTALTPGVYRSTTARPNREIGLVRTDIAAFVGMTERGPMERAVRLTSWEEYRRTFGGFQPFGYLPYSVRGFFENGGITCYVVRTGRQSGLDDELPREAAFTVPSGWASKGELELTSHAAAGQNQVQTVARDAYILQTGDVLIFPDGERGEVQSTSPALTLTQPLTGSHAVGEIAVVAQTARLSQAAPENSRSVELAAPVSWVKEQLIAIVGEGVVDYSPILRVDGNTIHLRKALTRDMSAGTLVVALATAFEVHAASPGSWGNRIRVQITPVEDNGARLDLRVVVDPGPEGGAPEREYLRRVPWEASREKQFADAVDASSNLIRINKESADASRGVGGGPIRTMASLSLSGYPALTEFRLAGGRDGLNGLTSDDYLGIDAPDKKDWRGLKLLEDIDEVAMVVLPDAMYRKPEPFNPPPPSDPCAKPPDASLQAPKGDPAPAVLYQPEHVYRALLAHCDKMRYRIAILDAPPDLTVNRLPLWIGQNLPQRSRYAKYGVLYFPWLTVQNPLDDARLAQTAPPSGHVAGSYARNDLTNGVHHPPAGGELLNATDTEYAVSDDEHGALNEAGVAVIRNFPGRGIRVWGARSISHEPEWRFIHVRRLMSFIERSVEIAMQWAVFESNDFPLRRTLVHMLSVFLGGIWTKGGFKGTTQEQAFYVKCDETNNPQSVIDAGQVLCQIGVAIAAPMEFIVFEIRAGAGGTQVTEV